MDPDEETQDRARINVSIQNIARVYSHVNLLGVASTWTQMRKRRTGPE